MKALLVGKLPEGSGWQYEIKLDGYRALALRYPDRVALLSRRNNDLGSRFPGIAEACEALEPDTIVDGEIVALDENGVPSFNLLQNYQTTTHPIVYYVFDILVYRGRSLLKLPLRERRELLEQAVTAVKDPVRLLGTLDAPPEKLAPAARRQNIEGLIAKRVNSIYEPGERSGAWVKYKINTGNGPMPVRESSGAQDGTARRGADGGSDEEMPLAQTSIGGTGGIHRLDGGESFAPFAICGIARRQRSSRGGARGGSSALIRATPAFARTRSGVPHAPR